jgi:ribosomal protein S18 acetylase RimI-like enzyme
MGEDVTEHFCDKMLFGLLFCCYYCKYEPEHCFVAEDQGKVIGYIMGSPDTERQARLFLAKMGWRILFRLIFVTSWRYSKDLNLILHLLRLPSSDIPQKRINAIYPAHLHIDILPSYQRQGLGTRLMCHFEAHMRQLNVKGIHLGTSEGNYKAVPFYKKSGYEVIHVDQVGMWPDAPEKRGIIFAKSLS